MPVQQVDGIDRDEWLADFLPRADQGDARAQIQIGWQCASGIFLDKDIEAALNWFRKAETSLGEIGVFNIMRMFAIEDDPRIDAIFRERDEWSLGAIYVVYANHLWRMDGNPRRAMPYFKAGGDKGSLAGWLRYRKLRDRNRFVRLLRLPYVLPRIIKFAWIRANDKEDMRVIGYW